MVAGSILCIITKINQDFLPALYPLLFFFYLPTKAVYFACIILEITVLSLLPSFQSIHAVVSQHTNGRRELGITLILMYSPLSYSN